jgi:hypothetical protein
MTAPRYPKGPVIVRLGKTYDRAQRQEALRLARKAWAAAVKSGDRDLMFRARHAHLVLKVWE